MIKLHYEDIAVELFNDPAFFIGSDNGSAYTRYYPSSDPVDSPSFSINDEHIELIDWDYNKYILDFNGKLVR